MADAAARDSAPTDRLVVDLPEEDDDAEPERQIRFVAGALDALLGGPDRSAEATVRGLADLIGTALRSPSPDTLTAVYAALRRQHATDIIDAMLDRLVAAGDTPRRPLAALARRLVAEAPDVEPVKIGIAMLGIAGDAEDETLLLEIGRSDEFTLHSVVALRNLMGDTAATEHAIWRLAQTVHGWGRIVTVERLAQTRNARIRTWLLREGFRNDILYEYLAYIAATAGGLDTALAAPQIDDALLTAAAEFLQALIADGPVEGIEDYDEAPDACLAFMHHALQRTTPALPVVAAVAALQDISAGARADRLAARAGWPAPALAALRARTTTFLEAPGARATVEAGLRGEAPWTDYVVASQLASRFGIDSWPHDFDRQRRRVSNHWWSLMQPPEGDRVEQVLALARTQLDLDRIGSGPGRALGLGADHAAYAPMDIIVQELGRFPGRGADLVAIGLRGRTIRLRHMAINTLRDWGPAHWPAGTAELIAAAERDEPEADVRARLALLREGRLRD